MVTQDPKRNTIPPSSFSSIRFTPSCLHSIESKETRGFPAFFPVVVAACLVLRSTSHLFLLRRPRGVSLLARVRGLLHATSAQQARNTSQRNWSRTMEKSMFCSTCSMTATHVGSNSGHTVKSSFPSKPTSTSRKSLMSSRTARLATSSHAQVTEDAQKVSLKSYGSSSWSNAKCGYTALLAP